MSDGPIDNVFRAPYELASVAGAMVCGWIVLSWPGMLLMTSFQACGAAAALVGLAAWRLTQARRVLRFRSAVRALEPYAMYPGEIPWSRNAVFLGQGFEWTARHTQRMTLLAQPENEHLKQQSALYRWARRMELRVDAPPWLTRWTREDHPWNPVRPLPPVGGNPALHGVEIDEEEVHTALGELNNHMMVYGTTRVGKTRLAQILIEQDIARGDVVIVFDPKGDVELLLGMYSAAVRHGRASEFQLFHLGFPEVSSRYNPIGNFEQITEVATRATGPLPAEGQSAAFKAFAWRYVNVIARAMAAVGDRPDFRKIYKYGVSIDSLAKRYFVDWLDRNVPGWQDRFDPYPTKEQKDLVQKAEKNGREVELLLLAQFFKTNGYQDAIFDAIASVLANDRTYFEKLVNSLYPLLEKLTTGKVADLISPEYDDTTDTRPLLDWMSVINRGGIVYCGFDALSIRDVAEAVSASMLADLTSTFGRIYKHGATYGMSWTEGMRRVRLHADELNELIGPEFVQAANKGGGAGLFITGYSQTAQDIEAKVGSTAKAEQISGNLNSIVMLRVKNLATAERLTDQLEQVRVFTRLQASGVSDTNDPTEMADFASRNEDRVSTEKVPMLDPAWLMKLPKGQAFALLEGGKLVKIRIPLPLAAGEEGVPENWEAMLTAMRSSYASYVARNPEDALTVEGA
ncbi:Type IV conjugative transfer system coupling protein TraD [Rubrivivax sp. A210]|uniref:type IV conjugative transfer system coupling protein TraD n=1 Tax=Rubrivivax sp. A210 TaxID=2772301 RepID=UPI00191AFF91|nr:type IV conjugative transfer system coupling protein TraD [Rubrivivax sp. A210]CAD5366893.1 Type IV conjugative transfer system coupling protein TraD [Rubrivivax sp. A210]